MSRSKNFKFGWAWFSPCKKYRYKLSRVWGEGRRTLNWIMLNPSTADAETNDPTVHRCCDFARRWDYDRCNVYNLFALRSTDPKGLLAVDDPIGPKWDDFFIRLLGRRQDCVAAWGAFKINIQSGQAARVCEAFSRADLKLFCLSINKDGSPKHPLYVPSSTSLLPYDYN